MKLEVKIVKIDILKALVNSEDFPRKGLIYPFQLRIIKDSASFPIHAYRTEIVPEGCIGLPIEMVNKF